MIGDPRFNSNNLVYLADGVGLPGVITIVLLILGMLQKYVAALAGPEARFCAMLLGLVAGAAYFQVSTETVFCSHVVSFVSAGGRRTYVLYETCCTSQCLLNCTDPSMVSPFLFWPPGFDIKDNCV